MAPTDLPDLSAPRRIHIVGLGGAGMSAIAEVLAQSGHLVSGSDLSPSEVLERLEGSGIRTFIGHGEDQISGADLVAISTAIPPTNPEVLAALARGTRVLRRAELLTAITGGFRTISVAGTHGKTTTSAMLTSALRGAGLDPSFIVGGDLLDLDTGAAVGTSDLLVVEADESDGTFLELKSNAVIVTNVEPDHLEFYGGFAELTSAFERFVAEAVEQEQSGGAVLCADDPGSAALADIATAGSGGVWTYGTHPGADLTIGRVDTNALGIRFELRGLQKLGGASGGLDALDVQLKQPGIHNARNAAAAIVMAVAIGADPAMAATALQGFGGVGRRFQDRGQARGVRVVEDYAHLPTELSAALQAARSQHTGRIVAAFQPHRFSRTEQLWETFTDCFADADVLLVSDIYSSGEAPREGITADLISDQVVRIGQHPDVRRTGTLAETGRALRAELRDGDLCLLLGAGDINTLAPEVLG